MKKLLFLPFFALFFASSNSSSTSDYLPLMMKRSDLDKSIKYSEAQSLTELGKIFTIGKYIFITQKYKGIHVIDNSDPTKPNNAGFITIPGCANVAIKGSYLYADNAVDLVTLDISDIGNIKVVNRIKNVFPELFPPNSYYMPDDFSSSHRPKDMVIIGWIKNPNVNTNNYIAK
jgi:hypothetical protein